MQTILGANGQIGEELARELRRNFTSSIRIVSRNAKKVNDTDEIFSADLSIREKAVEAVKGSEIAYFTLGLPISSDLWEKQFSLILRHVIDACKINHTKLVFFDNIKEGSKLKVPLSANKKRSLIWTPDASRATALIGNTPDAFGQTWHLPVDKSHPTYKEFIRMAAGIYGRDLKYSVVRKLMFKIGSFFNKSVKELLELLPRYEHDNLFDDSKFRTKFPDFQVTSYKQGISIIKDEQLSPNKIIK
ncbi:NAD(P)H-binding protein [Sphingobacterium thalpophilum]|uniref:NAD(P)H-binding protein n=1 Tax=Sphingobacterium thalpophilum TaxID=259 RepID=UPI0031D91494